MIRPILLLLLLVLACPAAEWSCEIDPGKPTVVALPLDALATAGGLRLHAVRASARDEDDAWIELRLIAADGRRFSIANPLALAGGERSASAGIGLDAGSWAGDDGPLGADAVLALQAMELAVHGRSERVRVRVEALPSAGGNPSLVVVQLHPGLIDVGAWREWRLRLAGGGDGERGEVDLVDASGRHWPLFLDQPGAPDAAGRWRAHGPARWVLRLARDEQPPGPASLAWKAGERTWTSGALAVPAMLSGREELPTAAKGELPIPRSPAWTAAAYRCMGDAWIRLGQQAVPEALAPVLAWRGDWTGFRGPGAIAWPQAGALDRLAAGGLQAVDLLPDGLADEQGSFRFGLSPWTGSVWRGPRDLWEDDRPWQAWAAHVRVVVARLRAAPGLELWTLGALRSATGDAQRARLQRVAGGLAALVAAIDQRPLRARHPQLAAFQRSDPQGSWYGFKDGPAGWALGPPPLAGPASLVATGGSDGDACIAAMVPPGEDPRVVGLRVAPDVNLANLDRLEFDAALDGGGEATLFAWVSDHHHRWWQQRLARLGGDGLWQTVGVDFSAAGAWTGAAPDVAWSDDVRRRIRSLGVVAYVRGGAAASARVRIDRVRRLGWPQLAAASLAIEDLAAAATISRWQPIDAAFRLNLTATNPYDPDEADVVGELEGPAGERRRHPAYWDEPYRLDFDGTTEQAVPAGEGRWRWRWTPPTVGDWRWRIVARVKWRGEWQKTESSWRSVTVSAAPGGMVPVRVDPTDRRWFSTVEGKFWYPIGLNLRSPGDERQDGNLARERDFRPMAEEPEAIRGWRSADWQRRGTRAYERWFPLMKANGMDWARVWMCPWWCGLEWRRDWDDYGGLGWYSQANAARMDRVMELAAANGVYVQVELMNHGMVSDSVDRQWLDSPYNRANGGPIRRAGDWFGSEEVWKAHVKRLRYTLARWGWCSNLAAWVLSSEMEFSGTFRQETGGNDAAHSPTIAAWVKRSLAWMREHDVFPDRPVSIHFSHPWSDPQLWRSEGLGFSNSNAYTAFQDIDPSLGRGRINRRDLPLALEAYLDDLYPPKQLNRPTLVGEWGGHWEHNEPWSLRGELRTGLWVQACTPYAANTGFWWWLWLDVADAWAAYAPIGRFLAGEDPRGVEWTTIRPGLRGATGRVQAIGMRGGDRLRLYVWPRGMDQDHRVTAPKSPCEVVVNEVRAGSRWQLQRFDCTTGAVVASGELVAGAQGQLVIAIPSLEPDAAFKLVRLP